MAGLGQRPQRADGDQVVVAEHRVRGYSFESVNSPGQYLRHQNSRVRNSPNDGSALTRADATWCARVGLTGTGVSLGSYNFRGRYLRHYNSEVWLSNGAGGDPYNTPTLWAADSTWTIAAPWAP
ncbi:MULTISPECIES: AbfB domain-containing protein [unclassified Micromonospora]|uniref:AbfB domain-containing protein n=1 Tax=unclassified Micromonospora TaxID=2617518 RepID=UPI0033BE9B10